MVPCRAYPLAQVVERVVHKVLPCTAARPRSAAQRTAKGAPAYPQYCVWYSRVPTVLRMVLPRTHSTAYGTPEYSGVGYLPFGSRTLRSVKPSTCRYLRWMDGLSLLNWPVEPAGSRTYLSIYLSTHTHIYIYILYISIYVYLHLDIYIYYIYIYVYIYIYL